MYTTNIIVAYSNFIALLAFKKVNNYVFIPMMASFIYHLSETKHNLPGISILNNYSEFLLEIDRFFAVISGLYVLTKLINHKQKCSFYIIGIIGFISLLYSEKDYFYPTINEIEYLITHCIWHFAAFYCLLETLNC